jgi:hypothetical protein
MTRRTVSRRRARYAAGGGGGGGFGGLGGGGFGGLGGGIGQLIASYGRPTGSGGELTILHPPGARPNYSRSIPWMVKRIDDRLLPIASTTPLGDLRVCSHSQRSNQAQEFLLLWSVAGRDEKGSDLNVGDLAT